MQINEFELVKGAHLPVEAEGKSSDLDACVKSLLPSPFLGSQQPFCPTVFLLRAPEEGSLASLLTPISPGFPGLRHTPLLIMYLMPS